MKKTMLRLLSRASEMAPVSWDAVMERVSARYEELAALDRTQLHRKRGVFRKELEKVDLTLEKRAMDLIWKFLTQDVQHLYVYPYRPQKALITPLPEAKPLPRATPGSLSAAGAAAAAPSSSFNAWLKP